MFELFLRHHYRLCMSKIPAGGAPSTLKSQRRDGDVGCTPFRWAVRAHARVGFGLSSSLCSSRLRAYQYSKFLSHNEQQRMPLSEQDEPEYLSNVFRTSSSRSNALPSNDARSDDAKPTHKPHAFTLVVVRARLCVHAARKARTAEGVGVWDRQQALVILFSRRGELWCSWLTTSQ